MQQKQLGASGLKVSQFCLGTMMFGGPTDEATSNKIVAKARDQGVNFIDTADVYNGGKSEEVTGRAIGNRRDDWVLATKLANKMGEGGQCSCSRSRASVSRLRRLRSTHSVRLSRV
jgi:aryl-alcohol dehydrogenase (NADP+)